MISPSALNAWETCGRKLAFQRDPATRALNRPSPRTALGVVAHGLTESAATGQPPAGMARRAWLEQEWEQLLAQQVQKLATAWPGRRIPPVAQWDGLVATRVRILRKLSAEPEPEMTTAAQAPAGGPGFPWIERRLEDPTAGVFGTPDRVDVRNGHLRVVDLKSGVHQAGIQDAQRRQLLLYAHLVDVACGQLPAVGVIEDVSGKETSFSIESVAVTHALHEAQRGASNFNHAIASGEVPAQPDETACRFCPFRSVCWPYWTSNARSDRDVRGTVIDEPEASSFKVDVGGAEALRVVITAGVSVPAREDEVVVLDVVPAGHHTVKMRWNSALRTPG
ncbi:PD-(D/E)XK nuclease family protein [Nocardioides mesophilus]|uniref:PD-(D/E)XK nuclease family protein n=1 Tax=Nocardioides mesophilus TaxID=433659 RepID=A0A7G9R871_9ACTN|nr:PD-(D/E)XK nuclease family protein [Nocardioides mesophilus]QNN51796.1 PD-(D/E)XK nuclease family protein [Nocardioides mesophilus]